MDRAARLCAQVTAVDEGFEGSLGLSAANLLTGERIDYNADHRFSLASVIKLVVLLEALRQAERGDLRLGDRYQLGPSERTQGSGVLKDLDDGLALTLRDLLTLMIVISD